MGRLDVFVCGQCHSVFHFIEEFQEHRTKETACSKVSHFRETNDVCISILCIFRFSMRDIYCIYSLDLWKIVMKLPFIYL